MQTTEVIKTISLEDGRIDVEVGLEDRSKVYLKQYTKSGLIIREMRTGGFAYEKVYNEEGKRIFYIDYHRNAQIAIGKSALFIRIDADGKSHTQAFHQNGKLVPKDKEGLQHTLTHMKLAKEANKYYLASMFVNEKLKLTNYHEI